MWILSYGGNWVMAQRSQYHWKKILITYISQDKGACLATQSQRWSIRLWSGGRNRSQGESKAEQNKQFKIGSFNNSVGLWDKGTTLSCLLPGPGLIQRRRNRGLVYVREGVGRSTALGEAVCIRERHAPSKLSSTPRS